MNSHWTEGRTQLAQTLTREQALHQARRHQQPTGWQALRQGGAIAVLLSLLLGLGLTPAFGQAATISVTNTNDSGPGSLRQAIADAAAGDTVRFNLAGCPCTITLTSGELVINKHLIIDGPGAKVLTISGNHTSRIFQIPPGTFDVTVANLTVANGVVSDAGGAIRVESNGTFNLINAAVMNNRSTGVFTGNAGGGLEFRSVPDGGNLSIVGSTFAGNSAREGGAIHLQSGTVHIRNTTIFGNTANGAYGGGIANFASNLTIANSTITRNSSSGTDTRGSGGGVINLGGTNITVFNSIIAANSGVNPDVGDTPGNSVGRFVSLGNNLISNNGGAQADFPAGIPNANGDLVGTSDASVNPLLAAPADNGGPTLTVALLPGSPAINAGNPATPGSGSPACELTDQRGYARPDRCDIGAFELNGMLDSSPPVITPSVVGTPGTNDWYVTNVALSWHVVDNESAISNQTGCAAQSVTSDTPGVTFTCSASSVGGSSSQSVTIQRDATAPTITFVNRTAANSNGWNNSAVTVTWSCSDATAGAVAASVSQTVSGEGANQSATGACTDNAGNSASDPQNGINIDKTAPTISAAATPDPNAAGWYNRDVTVHFTCADSLSGVTSCPADQPLNSEGSAVASTAQTITDLAGNSSAASNVVTVKIDKSAPTISAAATTQPNAGGWYNSDVTVHFTCADSLSGVTSCPGDQVLNSEGAAVASTAPTVSDQAGNSSAASNVVTVQIDKTAPVVTVTGVSNGASYPLGSVPAAGCSTTDALSGVATQATPTTTEGNADGTGSFTATCSGATDKAGNSATAVSVTYSVVYKWTGFFQPVDNLPTINTVNAGAGIPVKFSLGGDFGLNIFANGYPKVQTVTCPNSGGSSGSDAIEETVTTGGSGLQYDPTTQTYIYVWKTDKAWAGTCRQLIVKLIDGSEHSALFQFNGKARSADATGSDEAETESADEVVTGEALQQRAFLPLVHR